MASGPKTLDRAHPRYNTDGAHAGDRWCDVRFTADELKQFDAELAKIEVKGERLPKMVLDFANAEALVKK